MLTKNSFGISSHKTIKVTDLERTVLDNIKDFDKIGGLEELLRCLSMITVLNEDAMINYLAQYHNQFLCQKAGYLLSHFPNLKLSEAFFDFCKNNKGNSTRYLYKDLQDEEVAFTNTWKLCIPKNLIE